MKESAQSQVLAERIDALEKPMWKNNPARSPAKNEWDWQARLKEDQHTPGFHADTSIKREDSATDMGVSEGMSEDDVEKVGTVA